MKTLKFIDADGVVHFVRPVRPSLAGEQKTYSEADTPKGTHAVIYQAIKTLRRSGVKLGFDLPQYTNEQIKNLGEKVLNEGNICPVISPAIAARFTFLDSAV